MDIIDIYRAFHSKTAAYTFFSSARETFSRIDHILGHRSGLNKYKTVEIIVLKNNWVRGEIKREIRRYTETNDNDSTTYQNFWDMAKAVIRGKFILGPNKQEQAQINNLMLHLLKSRKGKTNEA